ncbi:unnamed protein product, partial [Tenebrio molitor]
QLNEDHIKFLIPAIGDQIKFKKALSTIASAADNHQTSAIIDELPVVKGSKRSLFEANLEDVPIDIIKDSQTAQKRNKIDEHTSVLLLVDSPPGASPSTSHLTETWRLGSASTITELRNSDCGQNSSFLSVCHDIDKFDLR